MFSAQLYWPSAPLTQIKWGFEIVMAGWVKRIYSQPKKDTSPMIITMKVEGGGDFELKKIIP